METSRSTAKTHSIHEIAYIGILAALIAICSWISIPTPTEISFTLQTFAVCVVVGLLGTKRGTLSVLIYILLGLIGLPVFSGFRAGAGALFGATGGYIIGFLFMGLVTGWLLEHWGRSIPVMALSMSAGLAVCYLFGTIWFVQVYAGSSGPIGFGAALAMCVVPYLLPDLLKIILAIWVVRRVSPYITLKEDISCP